MDQPLVEKLGEFYLGRPYDLHAGRPGDGYILYDSRDLTTHALIVGMTGSGKTGLGIDLIEEAAIDGVPVIAIDPKGDLANLCLQFPQLRAADFAPWVDPGEATRAGLSVDTFAAQQADRWKQGLAEWHQDGSRMTRLQQAAELALYTPGSSAARPLSLLRALKPPTPAILEDRELFTARVNATVSSLLALLGVEADPLRDREHILLSTIVSHAWQAGESLELDTLVRRVQDPPVTRLGALDLEAIYPAKDRLALSIQLNGLLAAPGAAQWMDGEPLQIDRLFHTESGKPRVSVISIAHLNDAERMFFVSLLLQELIGWMRAQPGTGSLRAILYMDEVAGYLPPVANPPSKAAFLLLLKQARAFGLGLVLATQNPVDLDYKGLSNIGTWFLGRLQTERDKARVLDGLESAQQTVTGGMTREDIDRTLSALGKRVFLLHNVKAKAPVIFETRWTLSYLRGPLTREQLKQIHQRLGGAADAAATARASGAEALVSSAKATASSLPPGASMLPPVLPPGVTQAFVPPDPTTGGARHYEPRILGVATVRFVDARRGVDSVRTVARLATVQEGVVAVDWSAAAEAAVAPDDLESEPRPGASFGELPSIAASPKSYATFAKDFGRYLATTETLALSSCPSLGAVAGPDEDERAFRIRLQVAARERRDADKDALQAKYAPKLAAMTERVRKAQEKQTAETDQASQHKLQTALSFGATILGAFMGRKAVSATTIGRAVTAARGVGRTMKETGDVKRAAERIEDVAAQQAQLEAELAAKVAELEAQWDPTALKLEPIQIRPKKTDVAVQRVLLAWTPRAISADRASG